MNTAVNFSKIYFQNLEMVHKAIPLSYERILGLILIFAKWTVIKRKLPRALQRE